MFTNPLHLSNMAAQPVAQGPDTFRRQVRFLLIAFPFNKVSKLSPPSRLYL